MLRPAIDADVDSMRAWRNQQVNRDVSVHQHEIGEAEHRAWWSAGPGRSDARGAGVRVGQPARPPLGVVTFFDLDLERSERTGAWGFYLDHETTSADGTLMTAWMQVMREATRYAFDDPDGPQLDVLTGEVLEGNEAVRAMNRRFRFTEGAPEHREVDDRTITVYPISLRREDRRRPKGPAR